MSQPDRTIPLRELRNDVSEVLRQVDEDGATFRVTVRGRHVADVVPVRNPTRTFAPWEVVELIRREAPLDAAFRREMHELLPDTIDDVADRWTG